MLPDDPSSAPPTGAPPAPRPRVWFLATSNYSQPWGPTRHILELLGALADAGAEITLPVGSAWPLREATRFRTTVFFVPNIRFVRVIWSRLALFFIALRAGLRDEADLFYARDPSSGWLSALAAHATGRPMVAQVVGFIDDHAADARASRLLRWAVALGQRLTIRWADALIATGDSPRRRLIEEFGRAPEDVTVVPRGIDLELAQPLDREACRRELDLAGDPLVVHVGGMMPWQGLASAIAAMPALLARLPAARMAIVGPHNPYVEELRQQTAALGVADAVRFVDGQPIATALKYIAAADVCMALYSNYLFMQHAPVSDKLLYYVACGRPVVCSAALLRHADDVRNLDLGEVCATDDPADFARCVERIHERRAHYVARAAELRHYAERWSWPPLAAATLAVFRRLLADRAARR